MCCIDVFVKFKGGNDGQLDASRSLDDGRSLDSPSLDDSRSRDDSRSLDDRRSLDSPSLDDSRSLDVIPSAKKPIPSSTSADGGVEKSTTIQPIPGKPPAEYVIVIVHHHHHVSSSYVEGWRVMALHASRSSAFLLTSVLSFNIVHCQTSSNHILLGLPFALLPLSFPSSITSAFLPQLPLNTCPAYANFCCTILPENCCSFSPTLFRRVIAQRNKINAVARSTLSS